MEYVYAAMLLHAAGKDINEENITKVLKAPGIKVDAARAKALVAALEDVDIDEAISKGVPTAAPAPPAEAKAEEKPAEAPSKEEEKKKKEEEEKKSEEDAMAGLGALFG